MSLSEKLGPVLLTSGSEVDFDVVVARVAEFRVKSRVELEDGGGGADARGGGGAITDSMVFRSTVSQTNCHS